MRRQKAYNPDSELPPHYLMQQRWMDPLLGRFLNRDLVGFSGGFNLFSYGNNNPTLLIDPRGAEAWLYQWNFHIAGALSGYSCSWKRYDDADSLYNALQDGTYSALVVRGHGQTDTAWIQGGAQTDPSYANAGDFEMDNGQVYLRLNGSLNQPGRRVNLKDLNLRKHGLKSIFLDNCNTAGGSADPSYAKRIQRRYPGASADWFPPATDDNIAHAIAATNQGIRVTGHVGIGWATNDPGYVDPDNSFKSYFVNGGTGTSPCGTPSAL